MRNKDVFSSVAVHSAFLSLLYEGPRLYEEGKVQNLLSVSSSEPNPLAAEVFGTDIARWRTPDPVSLVESLSNGERHICFGCGIQDQFGFHDEALYFHERLTGRGIAHQFESVPGEHNDALWKVRIKYSVPFHADHFQRLVVQGSSTPP